MTVRAVRALCLMLTMCALVGCGKTPATEGPGGDAERGKAAVLRYGCAACHAIPGIANQGSNVGPPLARIARRAYLGGVVPNTPADMVRWLRNPPQIDPRTAMPNMGISEAEAKDIAAYLYTLN